MKALRRWLGDIEMLHYEELFVDHRIDLDVLKRIQSDDLRALGIPLGDRLRLMTAIQALSDEANNNAFSEPERRQVTAMFCDIVGSTSLSERVELEAFNTLISKYHQICKSEVETFKGFVAKFMGDGVLSYFGYPEAHERDPERAIHAAFSILKSIKGLSASEPINVRIGIHTGLAITGEMSATGVRSEIIGETLNKAARLQGIAEPNSIAVSEETFSLTKSVFSWNHLGEKKLKGLAKPTKVYRPLGGDGVLTNFESMGSATFSKVIGRDVELTRIRDAWRTASTGRGQIVSVCGEAGIGKSRIAQEIIGDVTVSGGLVLRFQCSDVHSKNPFHPIIYGLRDLFNKYNIAHDLKTNIQTHFSENLESHKINMFLIFELLDIEDLDSDRSKMSSELKREETVSLISELITKFDVGRPLLVVFEDVHWADPSTLVVLEQIRNRISSNRCLLILTHRPDFTSREYAQQISLEPLNEHQSEALIDSVLEHGHGTKNLTKEIIRKSDGIPLFLEELVQLVKATKIDETGRFNLDGAEHGDDFNLGVPSSLSGVLMARVDALAPERQVLQHAAAVGRTFDYETLSMTLDFPEAEIKSSLDNLVDGGIIRVKEASRNVIYYFRHALLRDTIYDTILIAKRGQLHTQIAKALEKAGNEAITGSEIWNHWILAGQPRKAIPYLIKLGNACARKFSMSEAHWHFERAYRLCSDIGFDVESQLIFELLSEWFEVSYIRWELKSIIENSKLLMNLIGEAPDSIELSRIYSWLSYSYADAYMYQEALEAAEKSMKIAENLNSPIAIGYAAAALTMASHMCRKDSLGRSAIDVSEEYLPYVRDHGLRLSELLTMSYRSLEFTNTGQQSKTKETCDELFAMGIDQGYPPAVSLSHTLRAYVDWGTQDWASALKNAQKAEKSAASEYGLLSAIGAQSVPLAQLGDHEGAALACDRILMLNHKRSDGGFHYSLNAATGLVRVIRGEISLGVAEIEAGLNKVEKGGSTVAQCLYHWFLGDVYREIATGKPPGVEIIMKNLWFILRAVPVAFRRSKYHYLRAVEIGEKDGIHSLPAITLVGLGQLLSAKKKYKESIEILDRAIKLLEEIDLPHSLKIANQERLNILGHLGK